MKRNRAQCAVCKDIIESTYRHDYVTCTCGEISVDGGQDYFKGSAKHPENFLPLYEEEEQDVRTLWEILQV